MSSSRIIDVMRVLTEPSACSYLAAETACLEYRVPWELNSDTYGELMRRGWRRFGHYVFRPQCLTCTKCRPLRIDVEQFRPTKSQRRAMKRNAHIEVSITQAGVSDEHIALFNAYHRDMTDRRGWNEHQTTADQYVESFIGVGCEFGCEFQYRDAGRLVGVSLVDVTDVGLSSMYFYHDPEWRRLGPGTFSILTEIETARRMQVPHLYLGYWIQENQSMEYKANFHPHELMHGWADDDREPEWA